MVYSATQLTLYPDHPTLIHMELMKRPIVNHKIVVEPLPRGILEDSIRILSPEEVRYWSYEFDLESIDKLYNRIVDLDETPQTTDSKSPAKFVGKEGNTLIFVTKDDLSFRTPENQTLPFSSDIALFPRLFIQLPMLRRQFMDVSLSFFVDTVQSKVMYDAVFDKRNKKLAIQGFVKVVNDTTFAIPDAKMTVVIGAPNFVSEHRSNPVVARSMSVAHSENSSDDTAIYTTYQVQGQPTIRRNSVGVYPVFQKKKVDVNTILRFIPDRHSFDRRGASPCDLILSFKNTTGFPLTSGVMRLYELASFVGEQRISSIAKLEETELMFGKVFDIKGTKKTLKEETFSRNRYKRYYQVDLTSYQLNSRLVEVVDYIGPNGTIKEASEPYVMLANHRVKFELSVPAATTTSFTYDVLYDKNR